MSQDQENPRDADVTPIPNPPLQKCCRACGVAVDRAHAKEFFDEDARYPDGLKKACRKCRAERADLKKVQEYRETKSKVDKLIGKLIDRASFGGSDVPHIAELFAKTIALMGGPNGFAMAFLDTYLKSDPGSAVRQRLLNQLGNMGNAVTQTGAAEIPNELLSPEELDKKIKRLAKSAIIAGRIGDAPPKDEKERRSG